MCIIFNGAPATPSVRHVIRFFERFIRKVYLHNVIIIIVPLYNNIVVPPPATTDDDDVITCRDKIYEHVPYKKYQNNIS